MVDEAETLIVKEIRCNELQGKGGETIFTTSSTTDDMTLSDGSNIAMGSSTGSKIGTATGQKLGLWGVTPIVQPVAATGGAMTVDQLLVILQTTGIVKQS